MIRYTKNKLINRLVNAFLGMIVLFILLHVFAIVVWSIMTLFLYEPIWVTIPSGFSNLWNPIIEHGFNWENSIALFIFYLSGLTLTAFKNYEI